MGDQLVRAWVIDAQLVAVDRDRAGAVKHRPHAAGLIRAAVGAGDVLALGDQRGSRGILGTDRCERLTRGAEQLLDRQLGVTVAALAEVVLEQLVLGVEQIARGPAEVLVLIPDLMIDIDHDRVLDSHALNRGADLLRVVGGPKAGRVDADHA